MEHNFGHGRGGQANLPVVHDLPTFAAHTACDLSEAAQQCTRRPYGLPPWAGLIATPVIGVLPPDAA